MLADEIKQFFHGDVAADDATLATYSRDYSIFKVKPQIVVFPKDVDDLKNLVQFVSRKKAAGDDISLTGRSAGTDMTGGPLSQSIIVSFTKYFNHIKSIDAADTPGDVAEAKVEPGVYFRDFEKELTARGLLYPAYPASKDLCALGGMVNNNSGGEKTLAYGKTEKYVRAVNLVMSDGGEHTLWPLSGDALAAQLAQPGFMGDVYRKLYKLIKDNWDVINRARPDVSKNSAGYYLWNVWDPHTGVFDITKLIVGSQGTLGLLAEAKLGLVPLKKHSRMAVVFLKDLKPVGDLVTEVLKFKPESVESYDDKTIEVAVKLWRQVIASMKGNIFSLGLQFLPEVWMVLRGGMPKMIMLVELTGDDPKALAEKLAALVAAIKRFTKMYPSIQVRALKNEKEEEKYWAIRRESFALLHNNTTGKDTAPFIDDFIVKPEYMAEVLPKVNAILSKYKNDLIYTIAGHPGNGNFHIIPLMDLNDPRVRALIPVIADEVYKLILQYHGSITAEHNDGIIRTPYLPEMYGPEIMKLFAEVKKIFDPLDIFNPGKKVGGDMQYSVAHIAATVAAK
ncbi:MAG TPA: FAD-binding oxidoreductase [Candidatus Paceibacterota bacterium]|jgi:FAD/FMN-containing dehydrogenase|nr:FAD-binding oxidoreductase [Candidatus Paceibacterota bacterium]